MFELLDRISLEAIKFNNQVLVCGIIIWLAVVACAVSSLMHQPLTNRQRGFWIALILGVPLVGLLTYLPFSLKEDSYARLTLWQKNKDHRKKNRSAFSKSRHAKRPVA